MRNRNCWTLYVYRPLSGPAFQMSIVPEGDPCPGNEFIVSQQEISGYDQKDIRMLEIGASFMMDALGRES